LATHDPDAPTLLLMGESAWLPWRGRLTVESMVCHGVFEHEPFAATKGRYCELIWSLTAERP